MPLGEMPLVEDPSIRVAVDLIGNRYYVLLTIVDYTSRYPESIPLAKIETEHVAEVLLDVFCRVGFPKEVLSDRGSVFIRLDMISVSTDHPQSVIHYSSV